MQRASHRSVRNALSWRGASDASGVRNHALPSPDKKNPSADGAARVPAFFKLTRREPDVISSRVRNQPARRLRVASAKVSSTGSVCAQLTQASVIDTP